MYVITFKIFEKIREICNDKASKNILFFLLLNFSFAIVELIYGTLTNSLGLISDSFHMFFDCTALLCGLIASQIVKWKSNNVYTFGYSRAEVLAGFANALFLFFIAISILKHGIKRIIEPEHVHHEKLLVVSVLGFFVNLVGIFVFNHGHEGSSCSHHSSSKSQTSNQNRNDLSKEFNVIIESCHPVTTNTNSTFINSDEFGSHSCKDSERNFSLEYTLHKNDQVNNHHHSHHHHHHHQSNQIIESVFLHILADTLGSVSVIISAILIKFFDWQISDAICSIFISILIIASLLPLLKKSSAILMQRVPFELEHLLPGAYGKVCALHGVHTIHDPRFWTISNGKFSGCLRVELSPNAIPKTDFWKSVAKKYCEICRIWIYDNKASIQIHEGGANHKQKLAKRLSDIAKNDAHKRFEEEKLARILENAERQAMKSLQIDAIRDSSYGSEYKSVAAAKRKKAESFSKPASSESFQPSSITFSTCKKKPPPVPEKEESLPGEWTCVPTSTPPSKKDSEKNQSKLMRDGNADQIIDLDIEKRLPIKNSATTLSQHSSKAKTNFDLKFKKREKGNKNQIFRKQGSSILE